ncbi:UPF0175 family protein [Methanoregula sp.]|uniref:UPF0175 family protein n=1 Tax=Methanoregula sp. TaxID=2052170 RepID=UPI002BB2ECFA|nr:UPF0175 family protein [Methanoregula sp.]HVP96736.1 UPF0175 family protein [Methanoregula sp.]
MKSPNNAYKIPEASSSLNDEEKLVLFAIGSLDYAPIRSKIKIQKILFLVSNVFKGFQDLLDYEPHLFGPYSETLDYVLESLIKLGLVKREGSFYRLTDEGETLVNSLRPKPELLAVINDFKSFLNDLTDEEILVFVYVSYPQFISESVKWDELKPKRVSIALSLLNKSKISFSKAAEIAGMNAVDFDKLLKDRGMPWRALA